MYCCSSNSTAAAIAVSLPLYQHLWVFGETMMGGALLAFVLPIAQRHHPQNPHHHHHQYHQNQYHAQQHDPSSLYQRQQHRHCLPSLLLAKLGVCTDEDCTQQGAYQTIAKLKKETKGKKIQVESCRCLGMCGLGPCVSIDWEGSRMESRGGIDAMDDEAIRQILEDAVKPPPSSKTLTTQERDPYAEC